MSEIRAEKKVVEVVRLEMSREVAAHLRDLLGELSPNHLDGLQLQACDASVTFAEYRNDKNQSIAEAIYNALNKAVS